MATAASIQIAIEAQTAQLKKGFKDARQSVDKLGNSLSNKVAAGLAKFHLGLAAVKGVLATVRNSIDGVLNSMAQLDTVQKFADRIGLTADQLTVLNFAAEQTGASAGTMQMALQRMTRRISEAAMGGGEAVKALQELGLSAEYLAGLSPDQQFGAIADAMAGVTEQGDKVRLAMKLFDSEGVALVNTLAVGSEGLDKFGQEAESLGMLLGENRRGIEAANDAINRMKKAWGGLIQQIAIAIGPALEWIADILAKIVGGFNKLFGGGSGKAKEFGAASKAAAEAFKPVHKEIEKEAKKTVDHAKRAKEIIDKVKKDNMAAFQAEKQIGAVTRGSAAGFSAVQQAHRDRRDAERRHREEVELLRKIHAALTAEGLEMVKVEL